MANNWVSHVKEYAEKKKIKYTDAMKSQECKDLYQKNKPKTADDMKIKTPRKVKADKKEIVETTTETPVDVIQVKTRKAKVKK